MSPLALARRLVRETQIASADAERRQVDSVTPTYGKASPERLESLLSGLAPVEAGPFASRAVQLYCDHRFDLLGSGWTRVEYGMQCEGLEGIVFPPAAAPIDKPDASRLSALVNAANLREASRLWALLPTDYRPIDWQLDFRSGYRWDARTWYHDVEFGVTRGADIKLPWELSRMQHFPQMALEFGRTGDQSLCAEFRNQTIDWLATNPPRFGANWFSTMDVGIRAANLLVARDLFVTFGAVFDADFESAFARSIREHSVHILQNLEWAEAFRGNHYLADIAGLIFCAAYLPHTSETDSWLAFGAGEIQTALAEQFLPDGSNFEASTSYHRLSTEIVVYASALLERSSDRIPAGVRAGKGRELIGLMAEFTRSVTKLNGNVWQVGDNDSGRFLKLAPAFSGHGDENPSENSLDHAHLLEVVDALLFKPSDSRHPDARLVEKFLGAHAETREPKAARAISDLVVTNSVVPDRRAPDSTRTRVIGLESDVTEDVRLDASPFFGVYIFRGSRLFVGVRCGPIGQNGIGGHAHNDQLSIEVNVGGEDWIADPGTYLYTPLPELRNQYRSSAAHSAPRALGHEQASLDGGLFRLDAPWVGQCISFSRAGFIGEIRKGARIIRREVSLSSAGISIVDSSWGCELDQSDTPQVPFSPGYGVRETQ